MDSWRTELRASYSSSSSSRHITIHATTVTCSVRRRVRGSVRSRSRDAVARLREPAAEAGAWCAAPGDRATNCTSSVPADAPQRRHHRHHHLYPEQPQQRAEVDARAAYRQQYATLRQAAPAQHARPNTLRGKTSDQRAIMR